MKTTNLGPVLHCNHPTNRGGWPSFQRAEAAYFSESVDTKKAAGLALALLLPQLQLLRPIFGLIVWVGFVDSGGPSQEWHVKEVRPFTLDAARVINLVLARRSGIHVNC